MKHPRNRPVLARNLSYLHPARQVPARQRSIALRGLFLVLCLAPGLAGQAAATLSKDRDPDTTDPNVADDKSHTDPQEHLGGGDC
jgi:hypothetical protein